MKEKGRKNMFKDLNIVIGITGGIAAYKACGIVSYLKKMGANVDVIMTKNATEFITPLTLETLSNNKVIVDMFDRPDYMEVKHISLARKANLFLVVPATANIIGKIANGIADDMLSTTIMATKAPVILAPAMNNGMYENKIVRNYRDGKITAEELDKCSTCDMCAVVNNGLSEESMEQLKEKTGEEIVDADIAKQMEK